jgi:RNA polymerase sigma factor (sigma-70 family)
MAHAPLDRALHQLQTWCDTQALAGEPDARLLDRFVLHGEEAVFAILVRRHGPMVLAVARRVLRRVQDAEDVFQATFLLLARKAGSIRKREALGGWLHGVAHRLALRAKAQGARRKMHEGRAAGRASGGPGREAAWQEVQAALDAALAELPEKYRAALVLCGLEGKTLAEAGRLLGCPAATVGTRVARGRALLRQRLGQQGWTLSAAGLSALLLANAAPAAAPAPLTGATVKAVLAFAAGRTAASLCSARVIGLVERGLQTMFLNKLKSMLTVLSLAAVVAGAAALAHRGFAAEEPKAQAEGKKAARGRPTRIVVDGAVVEDGVPVNRILSIDPDSGACTKLADVGMEARVSPDGQTVAFVWDDHVANCDAKGGNAPGKLFERKTGYGGPVWSPDSKYLYVTKILPRTFGANLWLHETWRYDSDGRNPVRTKLPAGEAVLDVSPDGRSFLTRSRMLTALNASALMNYQADGTQPRQLSPPGGFNEPARFSPDGKSVAWCRGDKDGQGVWVVGADGKGPKKVFHEKGTHVFGCCWSPDGKRLAVTASDSGTSDDGKPGLIVFGEKGKWRIEIMDLDGTGRREVPLKAKVWHLRAPDWHRLPE